MRFAALAVGRLAICRFSIAALLLAVSPAGAQYIPRPVMPIGPLPVQDVTEIVEAMGLDPLGPPMRSGPFFVQRATDDFGRVLRVTVDARRSQVIAVEAAPRQPQGMHAPYGGPYRTYARAPYGRYPVYGAIAPDDDDADLAPPGSMLAPRAHLPQTQPPHQVVVTPGPALPQSVVPRKPAVKSAAVPPQRAPMPRKRPAAAPQETAGSVEPVPSQNAAPQNASPQNSAPPNAPASAVPAAPAKPQGGSMPPVAPLE